ncbi:MAG TPA: energy transducer TonB [Rhizomicrobium sp.]|nr:energy transducer TonB [Rhizomicrobium sp.]
MRTIAFLLLFTTMAGAQTFTPTVTVGPHAPVTPEWLGREMASVPACRAATMPLDPAPHTMIAHVDISRGAVTNVTAVTSSGNPAFDQKAVQCLQNLPADFTTKVIGDLAMIVPVTSNNGAVSPQADLSAAAITNAITVQHFRPPGYTNTITAQRAIPTQPMTGIASSTRSCTAFYPSASLRLRQQGETLVGFKITTDGAVTDVIVLSSSGYDMLDQAALQCAAKWRYKPAKQDGVPIAVPWRAVVQWTPAPASH